jgi:arylsulfatase A-like enzyme
VIGSLRSLIQSSPAFEDSGAQQDLLDNLDDADAALRSIKRQNRDALRQANRQVRLGAAARAPHIVLIVAEQLAVADFGRPAEGAATPHLDDLAAHGLRFTSFYAGGPDPQSALWTVFTGRNTARAPRTALDPWQLREGDSTLADVLWNSGYATSYVGWWNHGGLPIDHGFDEWTGQLTRAAAEAPFPPSIATSTTQMTISDNQSGGRNVSAAQVLLSETSSFLERHARTGRPFFLHVMLPPAAACDSDSASASAPLPQHRIALPAWDDFVGTLLTTLRDLNIERQTCVHFTAACGSVLGDDSGVLPVSTAPFRSDEHGLSEGNLRVPLVVRWPERVAAGGVSDHVCAAWDLLPTLAEIAQAAPRPRNLNGLSFAPTLFGRPQPQHDLLYWRSDRAAPTQAVRKANWKGVYTTGDPGLRLYDLTVDPGETNDLADEHPDVVQQLIVRRTERREAKAGRQLD